jgi:hypothetical protein
VGPEQSRPALPAEGLEVAAPYCPAQHLSLEIGWRIQEDPVGSGLEAQVTNGTLAELGLAMLEFGDSIPDLVADQDPGPATSELGLHDLPLVLE